MASIGFELIKTNPDGNAITIANNGAVLFDAGAINLNPDNNISYDPSTGVFTFVNAGDYYVYWFVNTQTGSALDVDFQIQASDGTSYPGSSIFKTGQVTGSAIISPVADGTFKLVNTSGDTITLAIGNGMVTAEIAIVHIPTLTGVQAYVRNAGDQVDVPALGPIPFNDYVTLPDDGNVSIDTTTDLGNITISSAGTYLIDWWLSLGDAPGANQINLSIRTSNSSALAHFSAAVSTNTHMSGFAIITVTEAEAAGPFVIGLFNDTYDPGFTIPLPIKLSDLLFSASIRVVGTGL